MSGQRSSRAILPVGARAYMDGRDLEAQPPLTVGVINLWDGVPRHRVVGRLRHGDRVTVVDRKRGEDGRWYYQVKRGRRRGWVSAPFVSLEKHEPVGDVFGR